MLSTAADGANPSHWPDTNVDRTDKLAPQPRRLTPASPTSIQRVVHGRDDLIDRDLAVVVRIGGLAVEELPVAGTDVRQGSGRRPASHQSPPPPARSRRCSAGRGSAAAGENCAVKTAARIKPEDALTACGATLMRNGFEAMGPAANTKGHVLGDRHHPARAAARTSACRLTRRASTRRRHRTPRPHLCGGWFLSCRPTCRRTLGSR